MSAVAPSLWAGGPALPQACGHLCAAVAFVESDPPLSRSWGAAHALLLASLLAGTGTLPAAMLTPRISTRPAVVGPVCARALHVAQSVFRCPGRSNYHISVADPNQSHEPPALIIPTETQPRKLNSNSRMERTVLFALLFVHGVGAFGVTGNRPRGLLQPANVRALECPRPGAGAMRQALTHFEHSL